MNYRSGVCLLLALAVAGCSSGLGGGSTGAFLSPVRTAGRTAATPATRTIPDPGIVVANEAGNSVTQYRSPHEPTLLSGLQSPHRMFFDRKGYLYVGGPHGLNVYLPPHADPIRTIPGWVGGIAEDGSGKIYVAFAHSVGIYSTQAETLLHSFPTDARVYNECIAVNPAGTIIATVSPHYGFAFRVAREYSAEGTLLATVPGLPAGNVLKAVAFSPSGDLYEAGIQTNPQGNPPEIVAFAPGTTTEVRRLPGAVERPGGMVFDAAGRLFVADPSVNAIRVYGPSGATQVRTITASISQPKGVAVDDSGAVYAANFSGSMTAYPHDGTTPMFGESAAAPDGIVVSPNGNYYALLSSTQGTATLYPAIQPQVTQSIGGGVSEPSAIAYDREKRLYVANRSNNTVTVYAHDGAAPVRTITDSVSRPRAVALDTSGNLYVANDGTNTVTVYAPGGAKPARTISDGVKLPRALAFDRSGNLYVANSGSDSVTVYPPDQNKASSTIVDGIKQPVALAFDSIDNLYVASFGNDHVLVFAPGATLFERRITDGVGGPAALVFDSLDGLYVANALKNTVTQYQAESVKRVRTLADGIASPGALAFDAGTSLLFVANRSADSVTAYGPGAKPVWTITDGIKTPSALALSP